MNKGDLIEKIAAAQGISKTAAGGAIDTIIDAVTAALKKGDRVTLVGFGTFSVSQRKARNGRNPQTGGVSQDCGAEGCQIYSRGRSKEGGQQEVAEFGSAHTESATAVARGNSSARASMDAGGPRERPPRKYNTSLARICDRCESFRRMANPMLWLATRWTAAIAASDQHPLE